MSNLYQDAILDAKALRASAMANAKAALEEAFEPKIQEMIAKHLSEEEDADMAGIKSKKDVKEWKDEDGIDCSTGEWSHHPACNEGEVSEDINEAELEEILNQLEEMSEPEADSLNEAEEGEEEEKEEEDEEGEEGEGEEAAEETDEVSDETKVIDITLGDLKQVIQSLMPGQEMPDAEPEGPEAEKEEEAGEEVSLEEILDELSMEDGNSAGLEEDGLSEDQGVIQQIMGQISPEALENLKTLVMTGGSAAAIITAAKALFPGVRNAMKGTSSVGPGPKGMEEAKKPAKKEDEKKEKELKEAKATINALRKDLQEVNLLNAKYLYMNKLFKSKSLTESQKLKVVNALDRAVSVKEVKNTYETLKESLETKKGQLKESVGFASKPAGVAPKANIVEADQFVSRWQKLAGIK